MAPIYPTTSPSCHMLGEVPSRPEPKRAATRATSEPLRVYRHPSGAWLSVKVEQSWTHDATYLVAVGRGRGEGGNWDVIPVPFALYEDALALALTMFAHLVDPFADVATRDEAKRVSARRSASMREALAVDTLGPTR